MNNHLRTFYRIMILCAVAFAADATEVILPPDQNYTKLHRAAEHGDIEKAREALKDLSGSSKSRGEQLNLLDREGYTPLGYAARTGDLEIVKLLVKTGASVDVAENPGGWTPLLQATDQHHADVVRFLLEHGANPNIKTRLGKTPLRVALGSPLISYGPKGDRAATVQALLEKGADAGPIISDYDELSGIEREQRGQIETLRTERQRLIEIVRKAQEERQQLERECRRLEAECQRLNQILEQIRSAVGNPGYRPN